MLKARVRLVAAMVMGAALALPMAASAQQSGAAPAAPPKEAAKPAAAPAAKADAAPSAPQAPAAQPSAAPKPAPGSTAVPGWNNPPAWDSSSERPQYASVPGRETNRLIQGSGREWREFRNGPVTKLGGWMLVGILAAILVFYLVRGPMRVHGQLTGRMIERFNAVERISHWVMAIAFVILAISGIVILFGKHIVLPWLGYTAFSWLTIVSKNLHNFVGPLFMFSIVVTFLLFVRDNLVRGDDFTWLKKIGGVFTGKEYPSGRFNMLEKMWFWLGMVLLGVVMSVTGIILDFPNWNQTREVMQQANVIHIIAAVLFIAASFGHIYVGTIGMEGAYRSMRDGYVDEAWAKEHHELWYEEVKQGKRPEKIVATGVAPQPVTGD